MSDEGRPDPGFPPPGGMPKWASPVHSEEDLDKRFGDATHRLIEAQTPVGFRGWVTRVFLAAAATFVVAIGVCLIAGYSLVDIARWLYLVPSS